MDNKITKQRINDHLEYDWFKYLILVVAVVAVVLFAFGQINSERDEENVTFFFTMYQSHENDYSDTVKSRMLQDGYDRETYGDPILTTVFLNFQSPLTNEYSQLYQTHGMVTSDFLVIGKNYLQQDDVYSGAYSFLALSDEFLSLIGVSESEGFELLRVDNQGNRVESGGTVRGIRIDTLKNIKTLAEMKYEIGETEGDEQESKYESEFYLTVNPISQSIGRFGSKAEAKHAQGLFCLKVFFEMYG